MKQQNRKNANNRKDALQSVSSVSSVSRSVLLSIKDERYYIEQTINRTCGDVSLKEKAKALLTYAAIYQVFVREHELKEKFDSFLKKNHIQQIFEDQVS